MQIINNSKNTDSNWNVDTGFLCAGGSGPKAGGSLAAEPAGVSLTPSQELAVTVGHLLPLCPCYLLTYAAPGRCKIR